MLAVESPRTVAAILALAVLACYFNAFFGSFQFDDYRVIVDYSEVHSWQAWVDSLGHGIRPLLKFTYTLDWMLDMGTLSFHFTNLLLHLANAWLVYRLCCEFVRRQAQHERLRHVPLLAALLFVVHPAHTEAVTYICGRSVSLMTLFYLGALLAYVTGRASGDKWRLYGVSPLLFVLALSVKETAVTFPLALLVWEACCGSDWRAALRQQWPGWAILVAGALFFVFDDSYLAQMERSAQLNSLQGNVATQLTGFAYLLRQWALPLWLNIDPDLPLLREISDAALPLLFFFAICMLMFYFRRKRPWISLALTWALIQLVALYIVLPRVDIANDRQLYVAGWPLLLAVGVELRLLLSMPVFRVAGGALLLVLATLTVLRNQVYESEIALWEDTVVKSPRKARVHNNLGYAYRLAQRYEDARREYIIALQLDPRQIRPQYNLERVERELQKNPVVQVGEVKS